MSLSTRAGRVRSAAIKTGATLAVSSLVILSALGSATSAQADDLAEPIVAATAPVDNLEPVDPALAPEAPEAAEPVDVPEVIEPAAIAAPIAAAAAAAPAPVANDDLFPGYTGVTDLIPSELYLNDSDTAPTGIEIDDPAGEVTLLNGYIQVPIAVGFTGNRTFKYRTTGVSGVSNWATVTVVVNLAQPQPWAYGDSYGTSIDTALAVTAPGVMGNDDTKGGSVTGLIDVTGEVVIAPNGSFVYTPAAGFVGIKTFYYQLTANGVPSNWAKVSISVSVVPPVSAAPVAVADAYQTAQGVALVVPANGVLANDSSATAVVFGTDDNTGETTVAGDGGLQYTPAAGFVGTKTLQYRITEGGQLSNWATITIQVTAAPPVLPAAPVAVNDKYQTDMDTALVVGAPGVLANDSAGIVWWVGGFYSGTMTLEFNGSFVYTPAAGFTGTEVIEYYILNNGQTSNIATITIEVVEPTLLISNAGDPDGASGTDSLAFTGITSTWIALPAIAIFLLGSLALGFSAARRRRAGTV